MAYAAHTVSDYRLQVIFIHILLYCPPQDLKKMLLLLGNVALKYFFINEAFANLKLPTKLGDWASSVVMETPKKKLNNPCFKLGILSEKQMQKS